MSVYFRFWCYFVSVTISPVSLLLNLFLFPLVSFGVRYFYQLRGVSCFCFFVVAFFPAAELVFLPLSLWTCQAFWNLFVSPNQNYFYSISVSPGAVWRQLSLGSSQILFPMTPQNTRRFIKAACPSVCCIMLRCFVWMKGGQEMDECWRWKGTRAHVAAATLKPQSSVSVAESPRPTICPSTLKGTFVPPQGSFRSGTHEQR